MERREERREGCWRWLEVVGSVYFLFFVVVVVVEVFLLDRFIVVV